MLDPRLYSIFRSVRPFVTQEEFTVLSDALRWTGDRRVVRAEPYAAVPGKAPAHYVEPGTLDILPDRRVTGPRRIGDR